MEPMRMDGKDTLSAESVRAGIERMASGAEPAIEEIASLAREAAEKLDIEEVGKLLDGLRDYIRRYPLAAVAVGLAVGYLINRLIKARAPT
jgi:hypothetical protein